MRLTVSNNETGYDVVGKFVEEFVVSKENESGLGVEVVSGEFIIAMNPMYDEDEETLLPYNEYLSIDMWGEPCWETDWWEGQPIIDIIGITPIEDVVPKWRV